MTKQEAIQELKQLEKRKTELQSIIDAKLSPKELFWELMNGCVIYTEPENPNSIFWIKDGEIYFELENSNLWCRYPKVWKLFEELEGVERKNISLIIKSHVKERFRMKGVIPKDYNYSESKRWQMVDTRYRLSNNKKEE